MPTTTIFGGRVLSFGSWPALVLNSDLRGGEVLRLGRAAGIVRLVNGSLLNFEMQSKRTIGLTITSPTSHSLPMPPAVPVVMTSLGCTSVMICRHTSMFGSCGPSCDMCESDLKTTTDLPPMLVVQ